MDDHHHNPYAPPQNYSPQGYGAYSPYGGDGQWDQMHASRGSRFAARLIDGLLAVPFMIPGFIMFFDEIESMQSSPSSFGGPSASTPNLENFYGSIAVMLLPVLAFTIYQWVLIAKTGQTLAKKWMKIKVVRHDGSPVDFVSGVIMREWVTSFLSNLPYVGGIIGLVDAVMIFSDDHQCLHDKIAKTKVIAVMPDATGF